MRVSMVGLGLLFLTCAASARSGVTVLAHGHILDGSTGVIPPLVYEPHAYENW